MVRHNQYQPCIPTRGTKVPQTPDWLREIKYDGNRLRVEREAIACDSLAISADRWPDGLRLPDIEHRFVCSSCAYARAFSASMESKRGSRFLI
jgi:hypothetical protein